MPLNHCRHIDRDTFRRWLAARQIRPASLADMWGTHHNRPVYAHPNTGQPFVALPNTEAARHNDRPSLDPIHL
jgi:hypothetical protein